MSSTDPGGGSASSTNPSMYPPPSSQWQLGCEPTRAGTVGPRGCPQVSRSCPSCPLRFVLRVGLEPTTRIPKLGHQRCTSSFRCAVQPGASVTRGKGLGGCLRMCLFMCMAVHARVLAASPQAPSTRRHLRATAWPRGLAFFSGGTHPCAVSTACAGATITADGMGRSPRVRALALAQGPVPLCKLRCGLSRPGHSH